MAVAIGDYVQFDEYQTDLDGAEPKFKKGDILKVTKVEGGDDETLALLTVAKPDNLKEAEAVYEDEIKQITKAKAEKLLGMMDAVDSTLDTLQEKEAPEAKEVPEVKEVKKKPVKKTKKEATKEVKEEAAPKSTGTRKTAKKAQKVEKVEKVEEKAAPKAKAKTKAKPKVEAKAEPAKEEEKKEVISKAKPRKGSIEDLTSSISVASIVTREPGEVLTEAKNISLFVDKSYFLLGGVLDYVLEEGTYRILGYSEGQEGFGKYIKEHFGRDVKWALNLIRVYKAFHNLGLDEARIGAVGWSKLLMLVPLKAKVDEDTFLEYFANAESKSYYEFEEFVKREKISLVAKETGKPESEVTDEDLIDRVTFRIILFGDQARVFDDTLERVREANPDMDKSQATFHIVQEYNMLQGEMSLEEFISYGNQRFGLSLSMENVGEVPEVESEAEKKVENEIEESLDL